MFKVIIAGGRDFHHWKDDNSYLSKIDFYLKNKSEDEIEMITGCATGADEIPFFYEVWYGYKVTEFPADWGNLNVKPCVKKLTRSGKPYNALAGHIRNKKMAEYSDALIAFWDSKSKGTKDMIDLAKRYNLKIKIIHY